MDGIGGKAVFLAELDDDYQELQNLDDGELLKRTVCYYLLAPNVIIHPAYVWQSPSSHRLVHQVAKELLRPPFTHLELGAHSNIGDYMAKRIERLHRPLQPTRELNAYQAYGKDLYDQARSLSIRFNTAVSSSITVVRRDLRFRELLMRDLNATDLDQQSLASQLGVRIRDVDGEAEKGIALAGILLEFVRNAPLVSVDTVLRAIYDNGFTKLERSPVLRARLLSLYYNTYAERDEGTLIPATSKLTFGTVVNPYDSEVFWGVIGKTLGPAAASLAKPDDYTQLRILRDLRENSDWVDFTKLYFDTLETVDKTLWAKSESIVSEASKQLDPGKTRSYVLHHVWKNRKLDLAGAAFGALALPAAAFDTTLAVTGSVAGVLSLGAAARSLSRQVKQIVESYKAQSIVRLKAEIQDRVEKALLQSK